MPVWIELITQSDGDRFQRCQHVLAEADKGKVELWTSAFTLAEVYKRKCNGEATLLPEDQDDEFESFFKSGLVKPISLDMQVATISRKLCRKYPTLRKPQDAVHIASCIVNNVGELHTFDQKDLISLDGQITLKDGRNLKILKPSVLPLDTRPDLFSGG